LGTGCNQCGARAVGAALPKPEHQLPSYGRALVLALSGSIVVGAFATQTLIAMFQRGTGWLEFWAWIGAGETAAWRLKWLSIPVFILALWLGRKLYRSIASQPELFCGVQHARRGLNAVFVVVLLIATLIGITVPARLRQRKTASEAAAMARYYAIDLAMFQYQLTYKTLPYPGTLKEDLSKLPDPDGTIAEALRDLDPAGYQPNADVAVNTPTKPTARRGDIIRKVSLTATDDATPGGLSLTNYTLRLPGEDKILFTDDDWIGHDGVIQRWSEIAKGGVGRSVSSGVLKP
jgi:type II secretory pathway pseudopilin PulG